MRKAKFAVFALILTAAVAFAVSRVMAQSPREERSRPRAMMLEGRGGQLGVMVEDLDAEGLKAAAGAPSGVRIEDVDQDSPAAKAGLLAGDIVIEVDGDRVRSARQFSRLIAETPAGRRVTLGIVRDGKRQSVEVTPETRPFGFGVDIGRDIARGLRDLEPRLRDLEPRLRELEPRLREQLRDLEPQLRDLEPRLREMEPQLREQLRDLGPRLREQFRDLEPRLREWAPLLREYPFDGPMNFDYDMGWRMSSPRSRLGVQLGDLTPQLAEYFGAADGGVLVSSITKDSPAEKAGLKAGDVITAINGQRVRDSDDLIDELREATAGEVTIGILRDKKESSVKATLDEASAPARRRPI
jgi:membrane-associated protease RseP (regulator of RpoE activity)